MPKIRIKKPIVRKTPVSWVAFQQRPKWMVYRKDYPSRGKVAIKFFKKKESALKFKKRNPWVTFENEPMRRRRR